MNTIELWQAVLGELELSLSKANFTTWFKSTFISEISEHSLIVGVPNMFTQNWLEKKNAREIVKSVLEHTGGNIKHITFGVKTRQAPAQMVPVAGKPEPQPVFHQQEQPVQTPKDFFVEQHTSDVQENRTGEFSLNGKYCFETFIVGKQNELAHAAAQAVVSQPGGMYNPLFIYGGVGLGKTHLLQAVGNEIVRKNPQAKVLYVTSEKFTNDFINAVRTGQAKDFKNRYRTVDVLLIDDIQFITSKEQTQEEFFHTFNQLHQTNKQIVISSDRPPKAIIGLENRLISRLQQGMLAD